MKIEGKKFVYRGKGVWASPCDFDFTSPFATHQYLRSQGLATGDYKYKVTFVKEKK